MPRRALKPCNKSGCPALTRERYCAAHRKDDSRWKHEAKTKARGYGGAHRKWRAAVLARDPLCVDCLKENRVTPSTDAHHKDGNQFNRDIDNGEGLCRTHHNRKTHGEGRGRCNLWRLAPRDRRSPGKNCVRN